MSFSAGKPPACRDRGLTLCAPSCPVVVLGNRVPLATSSTSSVSRTRRRGTTLLSRARPVPLQPRPVGASPMADGGPGRSVWALGHPPRLGPADGLSRLQCTARHHPYASWAKMVDCRDLPITPSDENNSCEQTTDHREPRPEVLGVGPEPRPKLMALGGDGGLTLSTPRAMNRIYRSPVRVLHFDCEGQASMGTWPRCAHRRQRTSIRGSPRRIPRIGAPLSCRTAHALGDPERGPAAQLIVFGVDARRRR